MKKTVVLLFAMCLLLLTACEVKSENSEQASTDQGTLASNVLKTAPEDVNQASFGASFVETLDGYYYWCEKQSGDSFLTLLYFCPRDGDSFRPLCSKPNCKHEDENCNAFLGVAPGGLGYYNGALYTVVEVKRQWNVVKFNLDGTDHQVAATIDDKDWEDCSVQPIFHHGKLFLFCRASYDLPLEEQTDHLVVMNLTDFSQKEIATEFLRTARLPSPFIFYKDKLYLLGTGDKSQTYENYNPYDERLFEVDANTGEVRPVLSQYTNALYVTDSTLYFFEPDLTAVGYKAGTVNPGFREYDVEGGTVKDCGLPVEDILWVRYDEDYIYALGAPGNDEKDQTLYVLSRNYELLNQFELKNGMRIYEITSDRIYLCNSSYDRAISYYIDKSQIGSSQLSLISIKTAG